MLSQFSNILKCTCKSSYLQVQVVRQGHRLRGKRPGEAKSLAQVLEGWNYVEPEIAEKIDIGLPAPRRSRKEELLKQTEYLKSRKNDRSIEKAARSISLDVATEDVKQEWLQTEAPQHIQMAADHYGVFQDLFGDAYFTPYINLDITYKQTDGKLAPVYRGNVVKPLEAASAPTIAFSAKPEDLWTLVVTNPDGHLSEENKEYVHWLVGNIPGNDVGNGETVVDYLQPFPPEGVGFQRFIFVLYKQDRVIDFSGLKKEAPCRDLQARTFETLEFYRAREDNMTPAGLAFFQCDYDSSVRAVFHQVLDMEEPHFEYDFTQPYVAPPKWFARRKPFNVYMDKYRDPRDIAKDFLVKKLAKLNPFEAPQKPFPYQNIYRVDRNTTPSWLITEERRVKLGLGRINHQKDE